MSSDVTVSLDPGLLARLDALIGTGSFVSRDEAIRVAVAELLVDLERRNKIGDAIVEGYRRIPPGDDPW